VVNFGAKIPMIFFFNYKSFNRKDRKDFSQSAQRIYSVNYAILF